jgi:hypothetical protein
MRQWLWTEGHNASTYWKLLPQGVIQYELMGIAAVTCCLCGCRYEDAIVALKAKVKETEGEDMREAIQDKV